MDDIANDIARDVARRMMDRPNAAELLTEARRLLLEEVAPNITGDVRFKALMVANAIGIAEREISAEAVLNHADATLQRLTAIDGKTAKKTIRDGYLDGLAEPHQAMVDSTLTRLRVSNPKAAQDS